MPLETGNTLDDLNPLWPDQNDAVSAQDDHTRLIKSILQSTFGANPNPGEFNGLNWVIGGNFKVGGNLVSPHAVKAGAQINGADGTILGKKIGITDVQRISAGTYEVQLSEAGWTFADLHCSLNIDYSFAGVGIGTMIEAVTNPSTDWVRIVLVSANDPATAADPVRFGVAIFDYGRG